VRHAHPDSDHDIADTASAGNAGQSRHSRDRR
jgi:hypothetical protein